MLSINNLKVGITFKYENAPCQVVKASHLKMGRGSAVLQVKFKNLINGNTLEKNFKQSDKFEEASMEKRKADFLYRKEDKCYFMDESYEQFFLDTNLIKNQLKFLKESAVVNVLYFDNKTVGIELPPKVDLKVIEAPPAVRGDTAQGSVTKIIKLETGMEINGPIFIKQGDVIKVNTETGEYVERVGK
ncbi:MAG: elongation factor P [Candidatus Kuenenbacteria bacterium]